MSNILVTGFAGFIGYHLTKRLLEEGHTVTGIDNYNDYYSPQLKKYRYLQLGQWERSGQFKRYNINLCFIGELAQLTSCYDVIYHLAAVPGVRRSIKEPELYIQNNIRASVNLLDWAYVRAQKIVLASSSSVYGELSSSYGKVGIIPSAEKEIQTKLLSPYAMTKRAMELAGYTYHYLYGYDVICPRFFTVYGPAGRPDMAYFKFIRRLMTGEGITVYGDGEQVRDFTYIDDIVDGLVALQGLEGYEIINLGAGKPESLNHLIKLIVAELQIDSPSITYTDPQQGDVQATYASIHKVVRLLKWTPRWSLKDGIAETVKWFRAEYNKVGM